MTYMPVRITPLKVLSMLPMMITGVAAITVNEQTHRITIDIEMAWWSIFTFGVLERYIVRKVNKAIGSVSDSMPPVEIGTISRKAL